MNPIRVYCCLLVLYLFVMGCKVEATFSSKPSEPPKSSEPLNIEALGFKDVGNGMYWYDCEWGCGPDLFPARLGKMLGMISRDVASITPIGGHRIGSIDENPRGLYILTKSYVSCQ